MHNTFTVEGIFIEPWRCTIASAYSNANHLNEPMLLLAQVEVKYPITGLYKRWEFQEFEAPRIHDNRRMKLVRLSALWTGRLYPPPPRKYSWYSFLLEGESTPVRPEGWKISMTPSGIEPATFRLVAQCLNQLRHRVPFLHGGAHKKWTLPYRLSGNKKSEFI